MLKYVEYTYYRDMYGGTKVSQSEFDKYVIKASAYISEKTSGKASSYTKGEEVKIATCELVDIIYDFENNNNIKSESVDNASFTYNIIDIKDKDKLLYKTLYTYLIDTGLLYRGIC